MVNLPKPTKSFRSVSISNKFSATISNTFSFLVSLISIPYLIILYLTWKFWRETESLHGKCLISYIVSLALFYLLWMILQIDSKKIADHPLACRILSYACYASVIMNFSWLLVMSFDLWRSLKRSNESEEETKTFFKYCLVCFGLTAAVLVFIVLMESPSADLQVLKAEELGSSSAGNDLCWVNRSNPQKFLVFYGPIAVMILSGVVLLAMTGAKIYRPRSSHLVIDKAQHHSFSYLINQCQCTVR